jgi:hypothetical protein
MLKIYALMATLCCAFSQADSQTVPRILTSTEYKKGIYRTYSEFLQNSPSIQGEFSYATRSSDRKIERDVAVYYLKLPDSAMRARDMRRLWGFCDGRNIFVNEARVFNIKETAARDFGNNQRPKFRKFQHIGRYSYLFALPADNPTVAATPGGVLFLPDVARMIDEEEPFILNINNGRFFLLNKTSLTKILQKDKALLEEYNLAEKRRRESTFVDFIEKYNATHLHEADAELWFDREVVVLRDSKKEIAKSVDLQINDTLQLILQPASVQQMTLQGEKVDICASGKCSEIPMVRKGTTYILISMRKEDEPPTIRAIDEDVGKAKAKIIQAAGNETKKPE